MLLAQAAQAEDTRLFVDAVATQNGDGSRDNPFWRITDAVERARALRQEDHEKRIVIDVLPGTYTGSYDPAHLQDNPKLELLPIILNVSDLSLEGATAFDEDGDGLLTGTYPPASETLLTTDLSLSRGQMLLLIASTTDGMAGNQVSISGFVTDAQAQGQPGVPGFEIYADRVSDFSIHHNLVRHGSGLGTRLASGAFEANFCTANTGAGIFITGGSRANPASVTVRSNRSTQNSVGASVAALANFVELKLGANTLTLEPLQATYDINDPQDQQNIPNTLEAVIEGNDLSDNRTVDAAGLRCGFYPPSPYTPVDAMQPITGTLNVTVHNNRLNGNGDYGIVIDAFMANRTNSHQLTGVFQGTFENNELIDNARNAALFAFTYQAASIGRLLRQDLKYLQGSTLQVADLDGELAGFDYDHPLSDPFDGSPVVGNELIYNGEVQPNGIKIIPHP
jgi:hypothetical protein